jgi:broad specificity phosphatase PhoE
MPSPVVVLFIARHGETVLNADGCFRGNKDVPLNANGIRDAHNLAAFFKDQPLSFVVSSDKTRAEQTAKIIKSDRDLNVYSTPNLRALDVGDFSGQVRSPENVAALDEYLNNPDCKIPGGESLNNFKGRIRPALWEAFEIADDAGEPGLLVAHSSIVHETGSWLYDDHKSVLVEPGGVLAVYVSNGRIGAEPIYKPVLSSPDGSHASTVS